MYCLCVGSVSYVFGYLVGAGWWGEVGVCEGLGLC